MRDITIRYTLGILAGLAGLMVAYASVMPLRYAPLSLAETWSQFQQIPWFQLGIERRADWVANGLILIPFGFLFAGFLHWRRPSVVWKLISFLGFAVLQALFVCAIEFAQIWFPPRVLSQNDMLAGYIGGLLGFLLWHGVGDRFVDTVLHFFRLPSGLPRISILTQLCALALLLYGLLPMDVMLTPEECGLKATSGRITWLPFSDWTGIRDAIKDAILCSWALPLGVVLSLRYGPQKAICQTLAWCVAIELISLPIFGRHTSVTDVVVSGLLGLTGVWLAKPIMRMLVRCDLASTWLLAAVAWSGVLLVGFLVRYERLVTNRQELTERLWGILTVPLARAHSSSEFEAAENILVKLLLFAMLGFLLAGWCNRGKRPGQATGHPVGNWRFLLAVFWIITIGLSIEILQAFFMPLVPDVTDLLLYGTGSTLGMLGFSLLIPPTPIITASSILD